MVGTLLKMGLQHEAWLGMSYRCPATVAYANFARLQWICEDGLVKILQKTHPQVSSGAAMSVVVEHLTGEHTGKLNTSCLLQWGR